MFAKIYTANPSFKLITFPKTLETILKISIIAL